MLKALHEEIGTAPAPRRPATAGASRHRPRSRSAGRSRDNPVEATFLSRTLLNKPGSEKETWHVEFDLDRARARLRRSATRSGCYPTNDPALVDAVLAALGAPAGLPDRRPHAARGADRRRVARRPRPTCCSSCSPTSPAASGGRRPRRSPTARIRTATPRRSTCSRRSRNSPACAPIPRPSSRRSIRCSRGSIRSRRRPRSHPAACRSPSMRCATRSTSARGSASPRPSSPTASSPATGSRSMCRRRTRFGLPADPAMPIIMVGPGTGIAPFRAFLHERMATKAPGRNWLFFGHQRSDCDFFYEDELTGMKAAGVLTRLSLAWSRDGDEKFYVQDRMREVGRELWAWLADGAHVYVCGDAKRMAKDVERALVDIVGAARRALDRRGGRLRRRAEEGAAAIRRTCIDAHERARPRSASRAHHLPLLRRRLRRAGAAGRPTAARSIAGDPDHPANFGRLCSKGSALGETLGLDGRLLHPMLRQADGTLARVDWDTALDAVADGFQRIVERDGPDAVAFYLSGPAADRGLLRRQQADEGLPRLGQRRHQFAAVHGLVGGRPPPRLRRRHRAGQLRGPRSGRSRSCWSAPTPPGAIRCCSSAWCANRRERGAKHRRDRSAPHRDRRRRRPASLPIAPGTDTALFCGLLVRSRRHAARSTRAIIDAHTTGFAEALARAREIAPDVAATAAATGLDEADVAHFFDLFAANAARRHLLFAGREPVGAGHRQGQRHHQLPSRHRPHRQARHGAVLADRPAQRHGRARGRRARQSARRAHGLLRPTTSTACAASGTRRAWPTREGLKAVQMFEAIERGEIKALWVMATNPAVVAAARRCRARGAAAGSSCSSSPRTCSRNDTVDAGAACAAAGRRLGREGRHRHQLRAAHLAPARVPAAAGRGAAGLVDRRARWRGAWASARPSPIARPPTSSASMPRCRRSRTTARAISTSARWRRCRDERLRRARAACNGRCARRRGSRAARFFADGGFFTPDRKARFIAPEPPALARRAERRLSASCSTPAACATSGTP